MRVLVLGSRGIVGKGVVRALEARGHDVVEWDIKIDPTTHDLRREECVPHLRSIVNACDFTFFLAYDVGGAKYLTKPSTEFLDNNVKLMTNTFRALEGSCFAFASTQMWNMDHPYGTLKHLGEHYTRLLDGISVRLWNVYGYEEVSEKSHVIADFIHKFKTTGKIELLTNGQEVRQFLHADDCGRCLVAIAENFKEIKSTRRRDHVDVSSFEWITILDLARMITPNSFVRSFSDPTHTLREDPDRFILDYCYPHIALKDGIEDMIHEYDRRQNASR